MVEQFSSKDEHRRLSGIRSHQSPPVFGRGPVALAWAVLAACSNAGQGAPSAAAEEPLPASVCPSCVSTALNGGETSDFGGQTDPCTGDRAPLAEAGELLGELDRLRAEYSGEFEASLRWASGSGFDPENLGPPWLMAPSGYEAATRVSGRVELGEASYFVGRPRLAGDPLECPNWLSVPASVELTTEDGALSVTLEGGISTQANKVNTLLAFADLADAAGSLELHLDPAQSYLGSVSFELSVWPEGKRGWLEIAISRESLSREFIAMYPLFATFPDDGCDAWEGFPLAVDAPLAGFGGRSAAALVAEWRETLGAQELPAVWHDCSRTGVRVELGMPADVCGVSSFISFTAANRLISTDGRLDLTVTETALTADSLSFHSLEPLEQLAPGDFAARGGVAGVNPGTSPWLTAAATANFARTPASVTMGFVSVQGCSASDCNAYIYPETLDWPPESPLAPHCE